MINYLNFKLLSKVLCLMGCVYQSLKISELYFSYETITNVKYETHNTIDLPGITICVSKLSQITDEYREELFQQSNDTNIHLDIIGNLTIIKQMSKLNNISSRIQLCTVINYLSNQYVDCFLRQEKLITYLSANWICFTLFSQLNGDPDERYAIKDVENSLETTVLSTIILSRTNFTDPFHGNHILVQLHDRKHRVFDFHRRGSV